jgi:hypothetical protein
MKARESSQAQAAAGERAAPLAKGTASTSKASTSKASTSKASTSKASTSRASKRRSSAGSAANDSEQVEVEDTGGWFGGICDDLVDMHPFWPHPLLAVLEVAYGTAVLLFLQSTLGGPFFRCVCLQASVVQIFVLVNLHT